MYMYIVLDVRGIQINIFLIFPQELTLVILIRSASVQLITVMHERILI